MELQTDVLIIGVGIAGLTAAIKLSEAGLDVTLVTREADPQETNTRWAQGGIIYPKQNSELLIEDIHRASSFTSDQKAVQMLATHGASIIEEILLGKAHTDFSRGENGKLHVTKEGAHSEKRIIYKGDYTGASIQESLLGLIRDQNLFPKLHLLTAHTAIDLITPAHHGLEIKERYDHRVVGAYLFDQVNGKVKKFIARKTILATGGVGAIYLHHSNSEGIRGDGHAMAHRAGALLLNMEFIQFHPTTLYDRSSHRRFLISEAVRGEGGILLNSRGEAFMHKYHPQKELASRDVVARAISSEMVASGDDCVYLDISHKDAAWTCERFPTIYRRCLEKGIDITKTAIPVVPAAHYACGGIRVNTAGETTLPGLYAVGEVACTGVHGANRLASTSLLEGLTWGYFAANDIIEKLASSSFYDGNKIRSWKLGKNGYDSALILQDWLTLKQTMWNYVGLTRSHTRLERARAMLGELSEEVNNFYYDAKLNDTLIGLRNAIEVSRLIVDASLRNLRSIGCFYLTDQSVNDNFTK
ncbi:MAG: FAD-dependent oxidoreductase [Oligoflexia bacterium]|nr:FAD-dependent oxidoreductase [Oligoflexia bacterium]MBF0365983.1 FAD-dependent oxidoreductase [Oligoflexia bacterium]